MARSETFWLWATGGVLVFAVLTEKLAAGAGILGTSASSRLMHAIAFAEGFFVPGSRAQRNHNPGDLTVDTAGNAIGQDGMFMVYASDADGWLALSRQVQAIYDGSSRFYDPTMTIQDMAEIYTATAPDTWAHNVATDLGGGVTVNTPLSAI